MSKEWSVDNMKKNWLNRYVHDFSVDYSDTAVDNILDINNYLMKRMTWYNKVFGFVKQIFISLKYLFHLYVYVLQCISMINQEHKTRPQSVHVKNEKPVFFPFSIQNSKCGCSYNSIIDPYVKLCVPDLIKSLNIKAFNLMSKANETGHIVWHETCKCKFRLDGSVCNNKQR